MDTKHKLAKVILSSSKSKRSLIPQSNQIKNAIEVITETLKKNKKIMICGNGGSAADAQHLTAEFLVRLRPNVNRRPLPIMSLAMDTSTITACANDYDFKYLFSRNFEAFGNKGDVLIVISTSGDSKNIIEVAKLSKKKKITVIGFLGKNGGKVKKSIDIPIIVKSNNTARIQEAHIMLGHFIFEQVENILINKFNK
jgi:D-sedoheptulose 7-phosphate isomerase